MKYKGENNITYMYGEVLTHILAINSMEKIVTKLKESIIEDMEGFE